MKDPIEQIERLAKLKDQGILTQAQVDQQVASLLANASQPTSASPSTSPDTSIKLLEGVEIGATGRKFRLIKKIGAGGMGQVWQARDLAEELAESEAGKTSKPSYKALKVVNASLMYSSAAIKKLQKEAIRTAKLSHPNIINVFGWHQSSEGWLFVEMEYLQGQDLESYLIDYETGLSWQASQAMIEAIVQGLDYAHHQHDSILIHRDLKPGNIYLTEQGKIKLLDFGLAYQLRKSSNSGMSITPSTLQYMPPEAFFANKPDIRHDVYALACIIYEMLTGEPPFSQEKAEKRAKDEWPPQPDGLRDKAWQALKQGMAYKKDQRTATVKELWQAVQQGQQKEKVEPKPVNVKPQAQAPQFIEPLTGMELVYIPPGSFMMGSPEDEPERRNNEYQHRVEITQGFYLGKYTVTQQQWETVMKPKGVWEIIIKGNNNNPSYFKGKNRPVERVSSGNVQDFINKLNQQSDFTYRLPTEAEWEYAARAGTTTPFAFGDNITTDQANYNGKHPYHGASKGKYRKTTVKVGSFPANAWGLHEMHGNVWERVSDWYDDDYYKTSPSQDPQGPLSGRYRVVRGGGWYNVANYLRSAFRSNNSPGYRLFNLGFRLVRQP